MFTPGKSSTAQVTGKVDIYELTETGTKKKTGTLEVTCKKIPVKEYDALCASIDPDEGLDRWVPVLKEMITEIKGAYKEDKTPWTLADEDDLIAAMACEASHLLPLINFMGGVQRGDIKRKN